MVLMEDLPNLLKLRPARRSKQLSNWCISCCQCCTVTTVNSTYAYQRPSKFISCPSRQQSHTVPTCPVLVDGVCVVNCAHWHQPPTVVYLHAKFQVPTSSSSTNITQRSTDSPTQVNQSVFNLTQLRFSSAIFGATSNVQIFTLAEAAFK